MARERHSVDPLLQRAGLSFLTGRRIDLREGICAYSVRSPTLALSTDEQSRLLATLARVKAEAFEGDVRNSAWVDRTLSTALRRLGDIVIVLDSGGRAIGWTGLAAVPEDSMSILYLDSTGIVPEFQSRGVMTELCMRLILAAVPSASRSGVPLYLTTRTRNPVVYRMFAMSLRGRPLYPRRDGSELASYAAQCAERVARWLGESDRLATSKMILRDTYATHGALYRTTPSSGEPDVDEWFARELGVADAFLLVGRLGVPA